MTAGDDTVREINDTGEVKRQGTGAASELLRVSTYQRNDCTVAVMTGAIDENVDLEALFATFSGPIIIDVGGVTRVNSIGVHRWIPIVSRYSAANEVTFERVSYALVQNANVVANMFGTAQVQSCMAPYFCARCKDNVVLEVTREDVAAAGHAPPAKSCQRCNSPLEFDELDNYFGFMKPKPRTR